MIYQTHLVNLVQLREELIAAGLPIPYGLGSWGTFIAQVNEFGDPIEIDASWQYVEDNHIAMRPKTTEEYAIEFQATDNVERRAEINNMITGLLPHELVVDETPWPPPVRLTVRSG